MWFRRDLRLGDNPALLAACEAGAAVPLFVLDPALWGPSGKVRRAYLRASLTALDRSLGGRLVVRHGDPVTVLPAITAEAGAGSVHLAADFGPYGARRDRLGAEALDGARVRFEPLGSPYAVAPGRVLKGDGSRYRVHTPFQRAWSEHGWRAPAGRPENPTWVDLPSDGLPEAQVPQGVT